MRVRTDRTTLCCWRLPWRRQRDQGPIWAPFSRCGSNPEPRKCGRRLTARVSRGRIRARCPGPHTSLLWISRRSTARPGARRWRRSAGRRGLQACAALWAAAVAASSLPAVAVWAVLAAAPRRPARAARAGPSAGRRGASRTARTGPPPPRPHRRPRRRRRRRPHFEYRCPPRSSRTAMRSTRRRPRRRRRRRRRPAARSSAVAGAAARAARGAPRRPTWRRPRRGGQVAAGLQSRRPRGHPRAAAHRRAAWPMGLLSWTTTTPGARGRARVALPHREAPAGPRRTDAPAGAAAAWAAAAPRAPRAADSSASCAGAWAWGRPPRRRGPSRIPSPRPPLWPGRRRLWLLPLHRVRWTAL
mmetsp:Transcript_24477/g.97109  ORF Transcript_24477/g.97109 Transcript_24477/m.97109 type:complete len:358 (+) Transcript_24477:118-1191(+)